MRDRAFTVLIVMILCGCAGKPQQPRATGTDRPLTRIGFGSCAHQDQPQPIWDAVRAAKPDLFLLIGDNIYGDTDDIAMLREKYAKFDAVPGFAKLRTETPLLGTWDDHDYGRNDAGVEFPMKRAAQQAFFDFFRVAADSPRRAQEGIYDAQTFGPPGKRVQVILLDTRYFRSPYKSAQPPGAADRRPYVADDNPAATMLGAAQWRWLEAQLRAPAELRLLVSSIQVVSQDFGGEKWMNFPRERQRLLDLIRRADASGVVILSGDRHFADLSLLDGSAAGYPIYDLTSSGLTQAARQWRPLSPNSQRVAGMSFGTNFGLIEIDWERDDPVVSLQVRDGAGEIRINEKLPLSVLRRATSPAATTMSAATAATAK